MDKFDRIQKLHQIFLARRKPASLQNLAEEMDCSRATVERTIEEMRNYLNLPIARHTDGGWYYDKKDGKSIELPAVLGTEAETAVDISQLRAKSGLITLDSGYANTGACMSNIT